MINLYVIRRGDREIGVGEALANLLRERRLLRAKPEVVAVIPKLLSMFGVNRYEVVEADVLLKEEF